MAFSGDCGAFFRLVAKGAALELVTAGFYRFWLATDICRHLWSNTVIDGDAAEYTGRGEELLIGFLFALAILVPIYLGERVLQSVRVYGLAAAADVETKGELASALGEGFADGLDIAGFSPHELPL